jgi:hypothetical protein
MCKAYHAPSQKHAYTNAVNVVVAAQTKELSGKKKSGIIINVFQDSMKGNVCE